MPLEWLVAPKSMITSHQFLRISLAAHQEKDLVQDSAFDFQLDARMCPSISEGTVSQTSQYKDSKIQH